MPLRRTASSPSVRSSPYSYSLSSLNGAQAARGHPHRRSSGSETSNRRVLADIDWWRVTDGQTEPSAGDLESEEQTHDVVQNNVVAGGIAGPAFFNADNGVDHPLALPTELWPSTDVSSAVPTAEFAALSIAPQTPVRRARHGSDSSSSSLESTPEPPILTFEGLRLGLSDMDFDSGLFNDHGPLASALGLDNALMASPRMTSPRMLARANTFADCLTLQDEFASFYPESPIPSLLSLPNFLT